MAAAARGKSTGGRESAKLMNQPFYPKIARLYPSRWDQGYVASKLRTDPLYTALADELWGSDLPLLDLGCG